jgi:hypothetical protein
MNIVVPPAPSPKPNWVTTLIASKRAELASAPPATVSMYVQEAGHTAIELVEGGTVGGILGAAHGRFGSLDSPVGPIDGLAAGAAGIVSILLAAHPELSEHARAVAGQCLAVFTFRKMSELTASRARLGLAAPRAAKIAGEDPIYVAAQGM